MFSSSVSRAAASFSRAFSFSVLSTADGPGFFGATGPPIESERRLFSSKSSSLFFASICCCSFVRKPSFVSDLKSTEIEDETKFLSFLVNGAFGASAVDPFPRTDLAESVQACRLARNPLKSQAGSGDIAVSPRAS